MGNLVHAEPAELVLVVRLRRGIAGERKRVCHIVPVPEPGPVPADLAALCGEHIAPAQAEVMDGVRGMPCEACLARSARLNRHWLH